MKSSARFETMQSAVAEIQNPKSEIRLPLLLTIEAVAELLGVSTSTLRRLVDDGNFPVGTKITSGGLRWHRDTVLDHLLLDVPAVAEQLSISTGHLYRLVKHRVFPPPDLNRNGEGHKRWHRHTVEKWVSENCPP